MNHETMEKLFNIADTLLGPEGCPWDRKQTLFSCQAYLVEEVHELIEAIDKQDLSEMKEEAADVLWVLVFLSKLAEKQGLFTFYNLIEAAAEKVIRRHPHIFGEKKAENAQEVIELWQEVKRKEKKRRSALDGIPPSLPLLAKSQKIVQRIVKNAPSLLPTLSQEAFTSEEELGNALLLILLRAEKNHFPVEDVLRRKIRHLEKSFTDWEKKNIPETSS